MLGCVSSDEVDFIPNLALLQQTGVMRPTISAGSHTRRVLKILQELAKN